MSEAVAQLSVQSLVEVKHLATDGGEIQQVIGKGLTAGWPLVEMYRLLRLTHVFEYLCKYAFHNLWATLVVKASN